MATERPKSVGSTQASLTDGKITYNFLLNPETLQWQHSADYAVVSVLDTSNPDVTWKASGSTLNIPRVLFMSQGAVEDLTDTIKQLVDWTIAGATLKFTYGSTVVPRCHITRFTPKEQQWRNGKITQAEAELTFLISREPVVTMSTTKTASISLTDRERFNVDNQVKKAIKNPAIASKLKVPRDALVESSADGYVTFRNAKGVFVTNMGVSDLRAQGIIK